MKKEYYECEKYGPYVIDKDWKKKGLVRIKFARTNTIAWYRRSDLKDGRYVDPRQPNVYGVGFNNYRREESYFVSILTYWKLMLRRCYVDKTHTMDPVWHDFKLFYRFVNRRENQDFHVAITGRFLIAPRYHHYGPDNMIIVPNVTIKTV